MNVLYGSTQPPAPGLFALCQNQLIPFCFHFDIPEAGQFIRPVGFGPNDACHGVIHAIGSLQSPVQVKKTGGGIVSGYRQFSDHVDIPTKVGFAGGFLKETKVIGGVESLASLKKGSIIFTEESGNKSNKAVFTEPSAGNGILKNAEAVKAFGNTGKLSDRSTHRKIKAG